MRVLTILLRYGTALYPHAEEQVVEIYARQMPDVDRDVVVVDNALPEGFIEGGERRLVIGGDNSFREFSGFDRALRHLGGALWQYDLVHFVTDAFHTLYVDYLTRFDTALLRAIIGKSVCLGHIDCYNQPVELLGFFSQHWIRTCFFYMSPGDAKALGSFVSIRDGSAFFSGDPAAPFRPDAPLSRRYQDYLIEWITGQDIGQGVTWHSRFELTAETVGAFQGKAMSIMQEHLLAVRLRAMGCRTTDVTWLATALRNGAASNVRWGTPWQEQLANRDHAPIAV
jgi:hypothetical protein